MRPTCKRCLRPLPFCVCADLPVIASRTRVVLLQHPREARLAICSAWLTRIALANAELHRGVRFDGHERVREVIASPGAVLLYPGEGAVPVEHCAGTPPSVLVVIDATWLQSEKMLAANRCLSSLPRVAVRPEQASGYRDLRREPGPDCLSTIEAVAYALGTLERDTARYEPMRAAFRAMVDRQLACSRDDRRNPRHRRARPAASSTT